MTLHDPGFGPWQPPTARACLRRPVLRICPRTGAYQYDGEYLGRGAVRFDDWAVVMRFVASFSEGLGPPYRVEAHGHVVVLEALGSDEQLGMRLHIAAVGWLQAEGEPVAVDRVYVAPPGAACLGFEVKEVG